MFARPAHRLFQQAPVDGNEIGKNPDNAYLLSGRLPPTKPHAFHSSENADQPHVVIRLSREHTIRYLRIVNRQRSHQDRAASLTVWTSIDGNARQRRWQAQDVQDTWAVDLGQEIPCTYVKVGLPRTGTLHLANITIYGR